MSLTRRDVLVAGCAGGTALASTFFWPWKRARKTKRCSSSSG